MTLLVALLISATPVMHGGDGPSSLGVVTMHDGALQVGGYRSTKEMVVLGWAPVESMVLVWFLRRDANERGVVAHHSGWMEYGETEWINHHVAMLAKRGGKTVVVWMSSGVDVDAVAVDVSTVVMTRGKQTTCFRFERWAMNGVSCPHHDPLPRGKSGLTTILSVGDVMIGRATAKNLDRVVDAFAEVQPYFDDADLRLGNLESCFALGGEKEDVKTFFAPVRHRKVLEGLHFDVLSLANNHCDDQHAAHSQGVLADAGIEGLAHGQVTEANGVSVIAIRALPGEEWISADRLDALTGLRIATVHWGIEYATEPSREQRAYATYLHAHGVQLVLGHHPHVLQPLERSDAGVTAFSQGNFVFDQEGAKGIPSGAQTERGVLLQIRHHPKLGITVREIKTRIEQKSRVVIDRQ